MADNKFPDDFYLPLILWLLTTCSPIGRQKLAEEATAFRLHSIIKQGATASIRTILKISNLVTTTNVLHRITKKTRAQNLRGWYQVADSQTQRQRNIDLHIRRSTLHVNPSKLYTEGADIKFFIPVVHKSIVNTVDESIHFVSTGTRNSFIASGTMDCRRRVHTPIDAGNHVSLGFHCIFHSIAVVWITTTLPTQTQVSEKRSLAQAMYKTFDDQQILATALQLMKKSHYACL